MADSREEEADRIHQEVGAAIRRMRDARGLQQAELGAAIGVSQSGIAAREAGRRVTTVADLMMVARALRVPVTSLLPGEATPELGVLLDEDEALVVRAIRRGDGMAAISAVLQAMKAREKR